MKSSVEIVGPRLHNKGLIYTFRSLDWEISVLFSNHSLERAAKWGLSVKTIAECLLFPDEVLRGHFGRYIAHMVIGTHLVRAVYEYIDHLPTLVTVYFPYAERYFQGGVIHEDKILK